jgi:long-subunit fatty acid transport protein
MRIQVAIPTICRLWAGRKNGLHLWCALFAQGGMGTDYSMGKLYVRPESFGIGCRAFDFPLAYNVNPKLSVGGSLRLRLGHDGLQMAMNGVAAGQRSWWLVE